jgi:hypothetical protein
MPRAGAPQHKVVSPFKIRITHCKTMPYLIS